MIECVPSYEALRVTQPSWKQNVLYFLLSSWCGVVVLEEDMGVKCADGVHVPQIHSRESAVIETNSSFSEDCVN